MPELAGPRGFRLKNIDFYVFFALLPFVQSSGFCHSLFRFSCRFLANMTSKDYAEVSWTTAILVPEALESNFHALEDNDMIKWLGRATLWTHASMKLSAGKTI